MYLVRLMSWLKMVLILTNCTRFIQCSTGYETALLRPTCLDKIKQLRKVWLPLRADLVMYIIYLPNQSREEVRCWCTVMLIQLICTNLRCILVSSKTLSLAFGMMWWRNFVKIYQEKSSCYSDLFTSVLLLKVLLACKTSCNKEIQVNKKYLPDGICKPGRMIHGAYKSYKDLARQKNFKTCQYKFKPKKCCSHRQEIGSQCDPSKSAIKHSTVQNIHEWCILSWSNGHKTWCWPLLSQSMEVCPVVFCEHWQSDCLCFVLQDFNVANQKKSMLILTFDLWLQWDWLLDFHQEKGRQKPHCILGLWQLQMKTTMKISTSSKKGKRCKWHCMQQMRKETVYGYCLCNEHLCKDRCDIAYHNKPH